LDASMPLPPDWRQRRGRNRADSPKGQVVENQSYSLRTLWQVVRAELSATRQARAERRALAREIADYTSPRDLADLEAMLDRHAAGDEADGIRQLIAARAYAVPAGVPGSGR
jgi:hypothetical protein